MTTAPVPVSHITPSASLTATQFDTLAEIPSKLKWFPNLIEANPRQAYRQDIKDFQAFANLRWPENLRDVTRAHVITWRQQFTRQGLANDTIRRKFTALSSLYAYLCERHAVLHNPVLGMKRPRSMNHQDVTLILGDPRHTCSSRPCPPTRSKASATVSFSPRCSIMGCAVRSSAR